MTQLVLILVLEKRNSKGQEVLRIGSLVGKGKEKIQQTKGSIVHQNVSR